MSDTVDAMIKGMRNIDVQTAEETLGVGADPPSSTEPQSNDSLSFGSVDCTLDSAGETAAKCGRESVQGSDSSNTIHDGADSRGSAQGIEDETICPPWVKEVFFHHDDPFDDTITVMDQQHVDATSAMTVDSCANAFLQYLQTATRSPMPNFIPYRLCIEWSLTAFLNLIQSRKLTCDGISLIQQLNNFSSATPLVWEGQGFMT